MTEVDISTSLLCFIKHKAMKTRHFINFHIAGFTYYDGAEVFDELKIGTRLTLQAEPTNHFDNHAVAVFYGEYKLGYVPRTHNNALSKLLECGYSDILETVIQRVTPEDTLKTRYRQ